MLNLMFASTGSIVLLVVLVLLLIMYPVLMMRRNKREQEKQKQLINALKIGEFVLTYSGIFGKITEIFEKEMGKFIVIETGEKHKSYVTVSENAIYMIANNNPKIYTADGEVKEITEETPAEEPVEEKKEEPKTKKKAK